MTNRALPAILWGGLVAGAADIGAAALIWKIPVDVVFRSVARGWLGKAAKDSGLQGVLIGAASHFFICLVCAVLYVFAARRFPVLTRQPILCGALFGLIIYGVMTYLVVPLSAVGPRPSPPVDLTLLLAILANVMVGVIIALFAARYARR
ncbi:MAG: hypothetical protein JWR84_2915 [Caulobacter sp.]|nr:hypothetical protein [Caulobacter sp.]